jgi:phosphate transport system substrate-binding protein
LNKIYKIITAILLAMALSCDVPSVDKAEIKIAGSDTMVAMTEELARVFMLQNNDVKITVSGGGTVGGFKALEEGKADICMASRFARSQEIIGLANKHKTVGMGFLIANDAICIYLNKDNPVDNLDFAQLKSIFTCEAKKWSEFGGADSSINIILRGDESGTRKYFRTHILQDEDYCPKRTERATYREITRDIISDKNAVAFGSFAFHEGIKFSKVEGIEPNLETINDSSYPIMRYLHFYTVDTPHNHLKEFIDWCMSDKAQDIISEAGYIPIWQ